MKELQLPHFTPRAGRASLISCGTALAGPRSRCGSPRGALPLGLRSHRVMPCNPSDTPRVHSLHGDGEEWTPRAPQASASFDLKRQLFAGLYGTTSTAEEEGDEEPLLEERPADVPDEAGETSTSPPTGGVLGAWVDSIYAWLQPSLGPISMFLNDTLLYIVSRHWVDLLWIELFRLHPLPFCSEPRSHLPW